MVKYGDFSFVLNSTIVMFLNCSIGRSNAMHGSYDRHDAQHESRKCIPIAYI